MKIKRKNQPARSNRPTERAQDVAGRPASPPHNEPASPPRILIRLREVCRRTALSRSTIFRLGQQGTFPRRVKLTDHAVAWDEAEISEWINTRQRVER